MTTMEIVDGWMLAALKPKFRKEYLSLKDREVILDDERFTITSEGKEEYCNPYGRIWVAVMGDLSEDFVGTEQELVTQLYRKVRSLFFPISKCAYYRSPETGEVIPFRDGLAKFGINHQDLYKGETMVKNLSKDELGKLWMSAYLPEKEYDALPKDLHFEFTKNNFYCISKREALYVIPYGRIWNSLQFSDKAEEQKSEEAFIRFVFNLCRIYNFPIALTGYYAYPADGEVYTFTEGLDKFNIAYNNI